MLMQLSPVVRRQARRLCGDDPEIVEDAFQEARIRLWLLLEQGCRDRSYLLAATRNCILDLLRREARQPRTPKPAASPEGEASDLPEDVHAPGDCLAELETRMFIDGFEGVLRTALEKIAFTGEPMTGAERTALCRARGRLQTEISNCRN